MVRVWMVLAGLLPGSAWAGTLYTVRSGDDMLLAFDTRTRTLTPIGPLGIDFDFGALAWDASDGIMYMVGGRANAALYTVDLDNGRATLVGRHGQPDIFSLAWDPNTDTLYGGQASGANGLWQLNQNNGNATYIGNPGFGMSGADWDRLDRGIFSNSIGSSEFYIVDPNNARATWTGSGGVWLNDGGLAYDPDTGMYFFFDWSGNIHSFDPNNNYRATVVMTGLSSMDGASSAEGAFTPPLVFRALRGACPGPQEFQISNTTPNGNVVVLRGDRLGESRVPSGPCRGTSLPVAGLHVMGNYQADATGIVNFGGTSAAAHCGRVKMVALDIGTCDTSNIQTP